MVALGLIRGEQLPYSFSLSCTTKWYYSATSWMGEREKL
jgi:hypothetical protein